MNICRFVSVRYAIVGLVAWSLLGAGQAQAAPERLDQYRAVDKLAATRRPVDWDSVRGAKLRHGLQRAIYLPRGMGKLVG